MSVEISHLGRALSDRITTVVANPTEAPVPDKALAYGIFLVLLDGLISRGPLKGLIVRFLGGKAPVGGAEAQSKANKKICSQLAARLVGCIFLVMMFPYAFSALVDPVLQANTLYGNSPASIACISLASGYFLYDLFICSYRYTENSPAFLVHAVFCCFAYAYPTVSGHLHYIGAAFMMWELSTPFLYARWLMMKSGNANSKWMMPVNLTFVAVFFLCRVVYGPLMSWEFWRSTQEDLAKPDRGKDAIPPIVIYGYYVAMVTLNGLNYYWFSTMLKLAFAGKKKVA